VNTVDACFPTAVILAVPSVCAKYDEEDKMMYLHNYPNPGEGEESVLYRDIAKVLDGQHRIEGLKAFKGSAFQVNVWYFY